MFNGLNRQQKESECQVNVSPNAALEITDLCPVCGCCTGASYGEKMLVQHLTKDNCMARGASRLDDTWTRKEGFLEKDRRKHKIQFCGEQSFSIWSSEHFINFYFVSMRLHKLRHRNMVTLKKAVYFYKSKTKRNGINRFKLKIMQYTKTNAYFPTNFF
jgi:hypothetical protein